MKKEIKLFEAFAGIGSQYQALKNISNKMNWTIKPVGMIEWYIDAIIAYISIHYPNIKLEASNDFDIENISISRDSKKSISKESLYKIKNSLSYIYIYI